MTKQTLQNSNKPKSIKINAMLNMLREACAVLFPLITFPYCLRVLQVDNMGKISYGRSIISYFALIAALGVSVYGVREGVKHKENRDDLNKFVSEILTINLLTTIVSFILLFLSLLIIPAFESYRLIILMLSLNIFFTAFKLEWINTIFEDFLYITIRSIAVQLLGLVALLVFVKKADDYFIYVAIVVATSGIITIANFIHCSKYVSFRLTLHPNLKKHLSPMITFFSNSLAVIIYVNADMTMLGYMCGDYHEGLYTVSARIYTIVKQIMTAIYSVTIPKLTKLAENKDRAAFKKMLTSISAALMLLLLPASAGLILMADDIVLGISGISYIEATFSLRLLGISLIFAVGSGIVVNCLNTPFGREKISLSATVIAAVINIVTNLFMIPVFKQDGAAFTTIVAEVFVFVFCLIKLGKISDYFDLKELGIQFIQAMIGVVFIAACCFATKIIFRGNVFVRLCVGVASSCLLYGLFMLVIKNKYISLLLAPFRRKRS